MVLQPTEPSRARPILAAILLAAVACSRGSEREERPREPSAAEASSGLDATMAINVGLPEASGLAWRPRSGAMRPDLVAVGDGRPDVAIGTWIDARAAYEFRTVKLALLFAAANLPEPKPSQFEAVATDASGTVVVLGEHPARLLIFDAGLDRLTHVVDLSVTRGDAFQDEWQADPNSQAEGLVLLKRGHVLVLKEKNPILLVEFGPAGEPPLGFGRDTRLGDADAFQTPAAMSSGLVPLAVWRAGPSVREAVADLSDLAVGPDGLLYAVSDETAAILRLSGISEHDAANGTLSHTSDGFRALTIWRLARRLRNPEGLVLGPGFRPFIALDDCRAKDDCVFGLAPLITPGLKPRPP